MPQASILSFNGAATLGRLSRRYLQTKGTVAGGGRGDGEGREKDFLSKKASHRHQGANQGEPKKVAFLRHLDQVSHSSNGTF